MSEEVAGSPHVRAGLIRPGRVLAWLAAVAVLLVGLAVLLDVLFPFPLQRLVPRPAVAVEDRMGRELRLFLPPDGIWRLPAAPEEVPELLRRAVVAAEDRRFWSHPGVDPLAVARAALQNLRAGRVVSGGSTLTMQLARLAEPRPRTLRAKAVEAFRAMQLTLHVSKEEQLRLWLDRAPMGGNLEGVGAAARFLFGKRPADLSLGEIALLAVLPRAPARLNPARNPGAAKVARDRVLAMLAEQGVADAAQAREAMSQPLPGRAFPAPFLAPHAAEAAVSLAGADARQGRARIVTTLDPAVQARAESVLRVRAPWLRSQGLENAAVVVLDLATGEVLAWAGSADYLDAEHHGAIDAVRIRRSPGSALKPFLYALAFDQGRIAPESHLLDVPTDFGGYVARNYDETSSGLVTAEEALARSLNVPAVRLLAETGTAEFLELLRRGGLRTLDQPAGHYGLPLILGAGEVRLLDLTALYAALGRGGEWRPPRLLREKSAGPDDAEESRELFSPESAWLTLRILGSVRRPDLPESWSLTRDAPAVAWKTGTSFGHRDAWAVGLSRRHAVGVWTGNLDGTPVTGMSGALMAGPVLFDVFRAIEPGGSGLPEPAHADLGRVEVCEESRMLATPLCGQKAWLTVIPGRTVLRPDDWRRQVFVDARSGLSLPGECLAQAGLAGREVRSEVWTALPPELAAFRRSRGESVPGPPPRDPGCRAEAATGEPPRVTSPSPVTPYLLRAGAPSGHQRIALAAQAGADSSRLTWFQNGDLVASAPPGAQVFIDPRPGRHRLAVVDDLGRMDAVTYEVRGP